MTNTKRRMQNGGFWNPFGSTETERETDNSLLPNGVSNIVSNATSSLEGLITPTSAAPSAAPSVAVAAAPTSAVAAPSGITEEKPLYQRFKFWEGGSRGRRRRRCTKKHRHSSACKRMRKGKRTKGRKRR